MAYVLFAVVFNDLLRSLEIGLALFFGHDAAFALLIDMANQCARLQSGLCSASTLAIFLAQLGLLRFLFFALQFFCLALGLFQCFVVGCIVSFLLGFGFLRSSHCLFGWFLGGGCGCGWRRIFGAWVDHARTGSWCTAGLFQDILGRDVRWWRSIAEHFVACFVHPLPLGKNTAAASA